MANGNMVVASGTALEETRQKAAGLQRTLIQGKIEIMRALGTTDPTRAARVIRQALSLCYRSPDLLEPDPDGSNTSFRLAVIEAAQKAWELDPDIGHAYLIRRKGRVGLQRGYRGVLELVWRADRVLKVDVRSVHEGDIFAYDYGEDRLTHRPGMGEPGKVTHVYAIATMREGVRKWEVMTWPAIMAHAKRYSEMFQRGKGPWVSDPEPMAWKTVLLRLAKFLPLSIEDRRQVTQEEAPEPAEDITDFTVMPENPRPADPGPEPELEPMSDRGQDPVPDPEPWPVEAMLADLAAAADLPAYRRICAEISKQQAELSADDTARVRAAKQAALDRLSPRAPDTSPAALAQVLPAKPAPSIPPAPKTVHQGIETLGLAGIGRGVLMAEISVLLEQIGVPLPEDADQAIKISMRTWWGAKPSWLHRTGEGKASKFWFGSAPLADPASDGTEMF